MKITLQTKNEYIFYPDIDTDQGKNSELPEDKRFGVVVQKVSSPAFTQKYMNFDALTGGVDINTFTKLKLNVMRLVNAPIIDFKGDQAVDEKGKEIPSRQMTVDDLFDTRFPELFPILQDLQIFTNKLEIEGLEVKKS